MEKAIFDEKINSIDLLKETIEAIRIFAFENELTVKVLNPKNPSLKFSIEIDEKLTKLVIMPVSVLKKMDCKDCYINIIKFISETLQMTINKINSN